jgi:hypothetical protein
MECASLSGNFSKAEEIRNIALSKVRDNIKKGQLYVIDLIQKATKGEYVAAVELGIKALETFSFKLPGTTAKTEIATIIAQERQWYNKNWTGEICELSNLPISNKPEDNIVMTIFSTIFDCALIALPDYLIVLTTVAVNYAIKHGNTNVSPVGYIFNAVVLTMEGKYDVAYQFGLLALELNKEKFHNKAIESKLCNMFGAFINHIKAPFHERYAICSKGYKAGIATGDLVYAAYNLANKMRGALFAGLALPAFVEEAKEDLLLIQKLNNKSIEDFAKIFYCFALNLQGRTTTVDLFDCDIFSELKYSQTYDKAPVFNSHLYTYKIMGYCILGEYFKALPMLCKVDLPSMNLHVDGELFCFYAALTLLKCYPSDLSKQQAYDEQIAKFHAFIQGLARSCPANFKGHDLILQAEILRVKSTDQFSLAKIFKLYEDAIILSQESKLRHSLYISNGERLLK